MRSRPVHPLVRREILPDGEVKHSAVDATIIQGDPERERERIMRELRAIMFTRGHEHGWAFQLLSSDEKAALMRTVGQYSAEGTFAVAGREEVSAFHTLSHNHIAKQEITAPRAFCEAADHIAKSLIAYITPLLDRENTLWILPWRAGLVLGAQAAEAGHHRFFHLGARRDEETLETSLYYTASNNVAGIKNVVVADPMLATGNTVITALLQLSLPSETNLYSLSVIAAPEGVDNVIQTFPQIRVITGKLDECLNHRGFIVPGLGDFGDRYWAGLPEGLIENWQRLGLLSEQDMLALRKRMRER